MTGGPLAASDLTKLTFHKNGEGKYHCPVLFKVFNSHSHIVAVKTTGNVYSYEAVKELNMKTKNMKDLLDSTPFTKADLITIQAAGPHRSAARRRAAPCRFAPPCVVVLSCVPRAARPQDPSDGSKRELASFSHVNEGLSAAKAKADDGVRQTDATRRIMAQLKKDDGAASSSAGASASASAAGKSGKKPAAAAKPAKPLAPRWQQTTGKHSAGFTSTTMDPVTVNEIAALSEEESARQRCATGHLDHC